MFEESILETKKEREREKKERNESQFKILFLFISRSIKMLFRAATSAI